MTDTRMNKGGPLKRLSACVLSALLALPVGPIPRVWAAGEVTLESVEVAEDGVRIRLSGPAEFTSFTTANPPRLVVQILDAEYQAGGKSFAGKGKYVKAARGGQFERSPRLISRVVLDLSELVAYKLSKDGNSLIVQVGAASATEVASPAMAEEKPAVAKSEKPAIKPKPAAKPAAPAPEPVSGAVSADAMAAAASAAAPQVVEAKPDISKVGETGGMTTEVSSELDIVARTNDASKGDRMLEKGDSPPPSAAPTLRSAAAGAKGAAGPLGDILARLPRDLVTLDFDNTDVRDVLKLFAAKAKINLIYGPDVSGTLTLNLTDVPFHEAFRTSLSMMGLTTMQIGENILRVISPAALTRTQSTQAVATKIFQLSYAKPAEIIPIIDRVRSAEGRQGVVVADAKSNSIIVTESLEGLINTERLISQLDVRPKQVLIEAKLIEVGLSNSLHHGIQWDYGMIDTGKSWDGKQGTTALGSALGLPTAFVNPRQGRGLDSNALEVPGFTTTGGVGAAGRGTGVNLPASSVFGALTLGRVTNNYFLNATLSAAASQGKVKVLSDPKIATLNNQAANINVTTSFPYVTSNVSSTGVATQSVAYVVVGIQLSVTPSITADGRVMLLINPKVSQPSATAAASSTGAPGVDARDIMTTVLVKDGETIVIGGLISDSVNTTIAKIPILGDIPILGWLFKKKSVTRSRAELLIFVTPKILPD